MSAERVQDQAARPVGDLVLSVKQIRYATDDQRIYFLVGVRSLQRAPATRQLRPAESLPRI
jgi:hypothetical protein